MWKLLKSEFIKARSLRSIRLLCIFGILIFVALALVSVQNLLNAKSLSDINTYQDVARYHRDTVQVLWSSVNGAIPIMFQIIVGILAVLLVTNEYVSGTIKSSLMATPRRFKLFVAKLIFTLALIATLTFVLQILAFVIVWCFQSGRITEVGLWASLTQDFATNCLAPVLAVTLSSAIWFGFAWIIRNSTGAILLGISMVLILTALINMVFGWEHGPEINNWMPQGFFDQVFDPSSSSVCSITKKEEPCSDFLRGVIGLGSYTILTLAVSALIFQKRDA
ncbi:ABC transporter permease [Candidatus Saccharibacteria bacterium]|nr:ABC transporter permease [Candidatus Saccharibacteria bacterium]